MLYDSKWDKKDSVAPVFGRRWHSFSRLDIRPVLWSLRNRPEEWEQTEFTLDHVPSKHRFWTANGFWFYSLYEANGCSCQKVRHGSFSFIQKIQFAFARRTVARADRFKRNAELAAINTHFAEHFVSPIS